MEARGESMPRGKPRREADSDLRWRRLARVAQVVSTYAWTNMCVSVGLGIRSWARPFALLVQIVGDAAPCPDLKNPTVAVGEGNRSRTWGAGVRAEV